MKLQILSDTHLEQVKKGIVNFENILKKIDGINNLCLLGDIGTPGSENYTKFIEYCSNNYKNIFLIYGNHEFFNNITKKNKIVETMLDRINYSKDFPNNIYFLNNSCVYIDKFDVVTKYKTVDSIKIIGSTLWSNIIPEISYNINDYKNIYIKENCMLTPNDTIELFNKSKNYILDEIKLDETIKVVLLTHHGTHELCSGFYENSILNSAYVTDIPELRLCKNLKACINGHTHSNIDFIDNNILFFSNCMGYIGERKDVVKYKNNSTINI